MARRLLSRIAMLDRFLPEPLLIEIDHVDVAVSPVRAYEAARRFDAARSPLVRALFALRTVPDRLIGRSTGPVRLSLDEIGVSGGFTVLADEPGESFAVGAIGRFWEPAIPFVSRGPGAFAAFAEPGFAKVAWEIRFEPLGEAGARIVFELRLGATDEAAWRAVKRYFRLIGPFSRFIRRHVLAMLEADLAAPDEAERASSAAPKGGSPARGDWRDAADGAVGALGMLINFATPFLRGARSHWGLDQETADRRYPGDAILLGPTWGWTHGVEIDAPAEEVWPWVTQIGQDKGGFYSYQWLENLAGCEVENADRVHAAWARPRVGDALKLHPDAPSMTIAAVEPGRFLLAHAGAGGERGEGVAVTWLFQIERLGEHRCRLISRYRCAMGKDLATRLMYGPTLLEPVGFMMDRRMLLGVKERAEAEARAMHSERRT